MTATPELSRENIFSIHNSPQLSGNAEQNLRKISYVSYAKLLEDLQNQLINRGLGMGKAAQMMKVSRSVLFELEQAAKGKPFSLGFTSLWKIKRFILNSRKGTRKVKGVMQYPGKCVPFV